MTWTRFCPECGNMMYEDNGYLKCFGCNHEEFAGFGDVNSLDIDGAIRYVDMYAYPYSFTVERHTDSPSIVYVNYEGHQLKIGEAHSYEAAWRYLRTIQRIIGIAQTDWEKHQSVVKETV